MYPPREPNAYRPAEQYPGEKRYSAPQRAAISFKATGRSYVEPIPQESADLALDASIRLTGTLTTQPSTAPDDPQIAPKPA